MTIGYDKLNLNHELLLGLTFEEMTGTITHDRAKPWHPCTLNGVPTWNSLGNGLPYLDFVAATPDWLACPGADTGDLNFIAGDFSFACWANIDIQGVRFLVCRGLIDVDGWFIEYNVDGSVELTTTQLGVGNHQHTIGDAGGLDIGHWRFVGVTRSGEDAFIFYNGIDRTEIAGTHIDPATSARELHIGVSDGHASGFDGQMWYPRIWGRQLAEWEFLEIFQLERHWFGV